MAKAKAIVGLSAHMSTALNARIIARTRLEELYGWHEYVALPYAIRELHDLRIAAKRFRYTLEIFLEVLPPSCKKALTEVERIQEELGALHDSDVLIALLRLCLGSWDAGTGYALLLAQAQTKARKGRLLINPDLLACLLDVEVTPSEHERAGLEQLLAAIHTDRGKQYAHFQEHWEQLKDRNFFQETLAILAD